MTETAFGERGRLLPRRLPALKSDFYHCPRVIKSDLSLMRQAERHFPGLAMQAIFPVLPGRYSAELHMTAALFVIRIKNMQDVYILT